METSFQSFEKELLLDKKIHLHFPCLPHWIIGSFGLFLKLVSVKLLGAFFRKALNPTNYAKR